MILKYTLYNRIVWAFFIFCSILIATGCSDVTIPEKVYIPVKCNIKAPERPLPVATSDTDYKGMIEDVKNIYIYTETLESSLNFCIEGNKND